ncbi:isochorismatase domain-containing protein 2 [Apiospora phragmitis]|uniref:Isochorismatase domain-containing protein 2 n=1 Tax=Apiospora phragmitis TaxID=2905665 RepID=A0ABR1TPH9_9PEZI
MTDTVTPSRRMKRPAIFLLTTQKVLRAAQILQIPVYATTQNAAKLGGTVSELAPLLKSTVCVEDKTRFSMWTPGIQQHFSQQQQQDTGTSDVVLVGIESHICITQTTLDLLAAGHRVYVLADAVSSCNPQEVPLALDRLRAAGAVVTSSESWLYECMGDAAIPEFRDIARVVKETEADTKAALGGLLSRM